MIDLVYFNYQFLDIYSWSLTSVSKKDCSLVWAQSFFNMRTMNQRLLPQRFLGWLNLRLANLSSLEYLYSYNKNTFLSLPYEVD